MRVLVCGSRTFDDERIVDAVLSGLVREYDGWIEIHEGDAPGADRLAGSFAEREQMGHRRYPADWDNCGPDCPPGHLRLQCGANPKRYCPTAGHRRNQQMLDEGQPNLVVAFVDKPLAQSKGTNDMVTRAKLAGLPVYVMEKVN